MLKLRDYQYAIRIHERSSIKQEFGTGPSFSYAFCLANEHVEQNRESFVLADLNASWRDQPASQKQIDYLKKSRFSAGLDNLTKGQAATIIGSGALRKKD